MMDKNITEFMFIHKLLIHCKEVEDVSKLYNFTKADGVYNGLSDWHYYGENTYYFIKIFNNGYYITSESFDNLNYTTKLGVGYTVINLNQLKEMLEQDNLKKFVALFDKKENKFIDKFLKIENKVPNTPLTDKFKTLFGYSYDINYYISKHYIHHNKIVIKLTNNNKGEAACDLKHGDKFDAAFGTCLAVARAYRDKKLEESLMKMKYGEKSEPIPSNSTPFKRQFIAILEQKEYNIGDRVILKTLEEIKKASIFYDEQFYTKYQEEIFIITSINFNGASNGIFNKNTIIIYEARLLSQENRLFQEQDKVVLLQDSIKGKIVDSIHYGDHITFKEKKEDNYKLEKKDIYTIKDKVKVKELKELKLLKCYQSDMDKYAGNIVTIKDINTSSSLKYNYYYDIEENGCTLAWYDDMFEGKIEETKKK